MITSIVTHSPLNEGQLNPKRTHSLPSLLPHLFYGGDQLLDATISVPGTIPPKLYSHYFSPSCCISEFHVNSLIIVTSWPPPSFLWRWRGRAKVSVEFQRKQDSYHHQWLPRGPVGEHWWPKCFRNSAKHEESFDLARVYGRHITEV